MKIPNKQIIEVGLIVIGLILFTYVGYHNSPISQVPVIFSEQTVLKNTWEKYKENFIDPSGRTLDKDQHNITTSEGEGYTMLRAVWMDDKETFDQSYKFTKDNLKRPNDSLFSWRFGQLPNGKYGVLISEGGQNSASDGDTDIALALVFASNRFGQSTYLDDAKNIINDIWTNEVVVVKDKPYMGADNFEASAIKKAILNPSYFAPYAYRIFAPLDKKHDWKGLADNTYPFLTEVSSSNLDKNSSIGLPPEWVEINKSTGVISAVTGSNLSTDYGFNAFRIPWRIALDKQWFGTKEADPLLNSFSFLSGEWNKDKIIHASYSHDGLVTQTVEAPAIYGGDIGYFMNADPKNAQEIYEQKLAILYSPDTSSWKTSLSYYDDNWVWFGIGIYKNLLPNLAAPSNINNQQNASR